MADNRNVAPVAADGALRIVAVHDEASLDDFVALPWAVHARHPLWVPPLRAQDKALLTPGKHPFWNAARRELFLAVRGNEIAGRIAAIVDDNHNAYARERCGVFGFFECRNDRPAAHALFAAARDWLAGQGMSFMRGPINPSTNYTCGMLVYGFDCPPAIMMPWNPPYYAELAESWHLRKEQDLFAYLIARERLDLPQWLRDEVARIKAEGRFTRRISSRATLAEDIRIMLDLYRESWAQNWGFTPLSPAEADELVGELKTYLQPDFFVLFFHRGIPAAGMVALPDFNPLLKRLNGRIGITAPWHFWKARKEMQGSYRIILFGIKPEFRLMGLPLLLLDYMLEQAAAHPDFKRVEGSWVLEDNTAIDDLIEDFSGRITKRYRLYRRDIAEQV